MTDRPILFSAPMIKALLAGTKTQTRRIIKPQPTYIESSGRWRFPIPPAKQRGCNAVVSASREWHEYLLPHQKPWHAVGDRLWCKEAWSGRHEFRDMRPSERESFTTPDAPVLREDIWYWADGSPDGGDYEKPRSSMFMPRYASRITLFVEGVKVERLQDISEDDATAEGWPQTRERAKTGLAEIRDAYPIGWYAWVWNSINGDGAWEKNPWVVAYTFRVVLENIDYIGRRAA